MTQTEKTPDIHKLHDIAEKLTLSVTSVFKGKPEVVEFVLTSLFAGGHILLEDVPGTGKTILAKSLAKSMNTIFSRIQCTSDLMPSDITGSSVWSPKTQDFYFRPGPVMASVVLVDELNRATPRTQSALLEAMAEKQVSIDGEVHTLDKSFFVIATENPVESEGTFPLPEAQKDRFMMSISIGYPEADEEAAIILAQRNTVHPVENVTSVVTKDEIDFCREQAVLVHVDEAVLSYILSLTSATRTNPLVICGVSPRGSIALYKASQALAACRGRSYVTPEDVKSLFLSVCRKRIILKPETSLKGFTADMILDEILRQTPVPSFKAHS